MPRELTDAPLSAAKINDKSPQASAWDAEARVFPLAGMSFMGTALGEQRVTLSSRDGQELDVTGRNVTPRLGLLGTTQSKGAVLAEHNHVPLVSDQNDPDKRRMVKEANQRREAPGPEDWKVIQKGLIPSYMIYAYKTASRV